MVVLKSENPVSYALENRFFENFWAQKVVFAKKKPSPFEGVSKKVSI